MTMTAEQLAVLRDKLDWTAAEQDSVLDDIDALRARAEQAEEKLALANTGGLKLLYEIRAALGWNDKTSLSIMGDGVKRLRERAERAETALSWCVENDGECLGDNPARLSQYRSVLAVPK